MGQVSKGLSTSNAQILADRLLKENGFAPDGRMLAEIDPNQIAFEQWILVNPVGTRR